MAEEKVSPVVAYAWLTSFCTRQENGCLTYERARSESGYGVIRYDGKTWRTHRLAWHLVYGDIPAGLHLLHHCDNRPCLEMTHLYLGTQADNMRDKSERFQGFSRVTDDQALEIADRYEHQHVRPRTPGNSCRELASEFGITEARVRKIVHRLKKV